MLPVRRSPDFLLIAFVLLGGFVFVGSQQVGLGQTAAGPGRRVVTPTGGQAVDSGYQSHPVTLNVPPRRAARMAVPGEVLVKYAPQTAGKTAAEWTAAGLNVESIATPPYGNFDVLTLEPGADAAAVAQQLSQRSDVEYAQPSYMRHPQFVPNDPFFAQQWNLSAINMQRAWDINPGSTESVIVAVIDSGLAFEDATITFDAAGFSLGGKQYPALGQISVPFAAAL